MCIGKCSVLFLTISFGLQITEQLFSLSVFLCGLLVAGAHFQQPLGERLRAPWTGSGPSQGHIETRRMASQVLRTNDN